MDLEPAPKTALASPKRGGRIVPMAPDLLVQVAGAVVSAAEKPNTKRAYAQDWARWTLWCDVNDIDTDDLTVVNITSFLMHECQAGAKTESEGYALNTVRRRAGSLATAAVRSGLPSPFDQSVELVVNGEPRSVAFPALLRDLGTIVRRHGMPDPKRATALTLERLADALESFEDDLSPTAARDRMVLLCGFGALLRASELAGLNRSDIAATHYGLQLKLRETKTGDHMAPLARLQDPRFCPVVAVNEWLEITGGLPERSPLVARFTRGGRISQRDDGTPSGPDARLIDQIVRHRTRLIAEPSDRFSSHSLRRGGATSRAQRGATVFQLEKAGRWAPGSPIVAQYIEEANLAVEAGAHLLDLPLPTIENS